MNNKRLALLFLCFFVWLVQVAAQSKREFRGAWIQCVNSQWIGLSTSEMQKTLTKQLDKLQQMGVNAVIFQVRAECDALYESKIEPWSRYLTGQQGKAPSPYWDPLQWMVEACHRRNMELHAWINPFRAKTKPTSELANSHIAVRNPNSCFEYDGLYILNPGLPENRNYICSVVKDIVNRYDIDGLHIDDYFYPYPAAGCSIDDDDAYKLYSNGIADRGDWRRYNVNKFIEQLYKTIKDEKPWVKFGVSPFGIYRNKKSSPTGSKTNGLQNYDDLYADVLMWTNNEWVDYVVPQLYWQIGHPTADYKELIGWWNRNVTNRPLYIGEDLERTAKYSDPKNSKANQLSAKHRLHQQMPHVQGTVLWYAKTAVDNVGNIATILRNNYWRNPSLQPSAEHISKHAPKKPCNLKVIEAQNQKVLFWTVPKNDDWSKEAWQFAVYRFAKGEKVNLEDATKIVKITHEPFYDLPKAPQRSQYLYVVTSLNRIHNESAGAKKKIRY